MDNNKTITITEDDFTSAVEDAINRLVDCLAEECSDARKILKYGMIATTFAGDLHNTLFRKGAEGDGNKDM